MRVKVDFQLCEAHGECVVAAPEVFDLGDDDDRVTLLMENPPEELRAKVKEAVDACPVACIRMED